MGNRLGVHSWETFMVVHQKINKDWKLDSGIVAPGGSRVWGQPGLHNEILFFKKT
jgi:hypothetical protein